MAMLFSATASLFKYRFHPSFTWQNIEYFEILYDKWRIFCKLLIVYISFTEDIINASVMFYHFEHERVHCNSDPALWVDGLHIIPLRVVTCHTNYASKFVTILQVIFLAVFKTLQDSTVTYEYPTTTHNLYMILVLLWLKKKLSKITVYIKTNNSGKWSVHESYYYFQLCSKSLFITSYTNKKLIIWKDDQHFKNLNVNTTMKMSLVSISENITSESSSDTKNTATSMVSAVWCEWVNWFCCFYHYYYYYYYYYSPFKIYPRITGQATNFHSYGPVTCNKSGDVIISHSHMHLCNTHLQCFQLLFQLSLLLPVKSQILPMFLYFAIPLFLQAPLQWWER